MLIESESPNLPSRVSAGNGLIPDKVSVFDGWYLPGLGAYRLERATLAYADMLYRHGYSVVTFSNPFQSEFMDSAATVAIPGYGPADCDDVENALKAVMGDVQAWQKGKITRT